MQPNGEYDSGLSPEKLLLWLLTRLDFPIFVGLNAEDDMKNRNSWIGMAAIVVLLGGMIWFLSTGERGSSLNPNDTAFALEDTAWVSHIRIIQMQENREITRVDLEEIDSGVWEVNGTYRAFQPQIGHLLTTLKHIQVKEALTGSGIESAEKILGLMHTRVEVEGPDGPIKTYLVGTSTRNSRGTLMKLEGASQPFIVERPDLQGYINPFFTIDVDIWREKLLWRVQQAELTGIRIEYSGESSTQLWLSREPEEAWKLQPGGTIPDQQALSDYLDQFQKAIFAESFASRKFPTVMEKLKLQQPDVTVSLSLADGSERKVVMYEREDNPNSWFGWVVGEEEFYTIQTFVMERFLRSQEDFLPLAA